MPKKLLISLFVGILISTLTLYLAFRNVPMSDLLGYLATINYWWIVPTVVIIAATFVLRAFRWIIILKGISNVTFWQAFHPTMIGFMMNCILPGRVGEFARPALLKQNCGVPMTTGLATVAAERIFDLFILIALFALVFSTVSGHTDLRGDYFGIHLDSDTVTSAAHAMIRLSIALLLFIGLLAMNTTRNFLKKMIDLIANGLSRMLPRFQKHICRVSEFAQNIIENLSIGFTLVHSPVKLICCTGLTFLIWMLTAISYQIFAMGCPGLTLSLWEFTTVMVIICFVIALPSAPGFWGLWEAGGVFALSIFGIAEKDALGYIMVNHAAQLFPVIGIGLISALITSVNIFHLSQTGSSADPQPTP